MGREYCPYRVYEKSIGAICAAWRAHHHAQGVERAQLAADDAQGACPI
jgi:hypothetical protein